LLSSSCFLVSPRGQHYPLAGVLLPQGLFMKTGSAHAFPVFFLGLLRSSRKERPDGSGHPFGWGDATPIRSITDRHSLSPSSPTRTPAASPCGSVSLELSLAGGVRSYRVTS